MRYQDNDDKETAGKRLWRNLEELDDTEEFREVVSREFPVNAEIWENSLSRRNFLRVMGASFALGGLNACVKQPDEKILPYVKQPEFLVPGKPLSYATACVIGGYATGILVTSHMGRPTKIEGNPDHPSSLGSTDAQGQATLLSLYDPDRSQVILHRKEISTWSRFLESLQRALEVQQQIDGAGVRILSGTVTSPTLDSQIQEFLKKYRHARWHQFEAINLDNVREGASLAFGEIVQTQYHFEKADVVLSLDADFLGAGIGNIRHARDFSERRSVQGAPASMNRLYVAECMPSVTGSMADHRLKTRPSQIAPLVRILAARLGIMESSETNLDQDLTHWISVVGRDLQAHAGSSIVLAGPEQPAAVHALVHAINFALNNYDRTITHSDPVESNPVNHVSSLASLVEDIEKGEVDLLLVLGQNPVYDAPADFRMAERIASVEMSVHLGLYRDETAERCTWHVPASHYLEAWSDARACDGTVSIMQPLIAPLYNTTRSHHEVMEEFLGRSGGKGYDIVVDYWKERKGVGPFDEFWKSSLHLGIVEGTSLPKKAVTPKLNSVDLEFPAAGSGLEISFRPDPSLWDGSFANNGWLQELPKPITKLTWDNAVMVSPETAERLGLMNEDVVEARVNASAVQAPIWIVPGHADEAITLHIGYGRSFEGRVGSGVGVNANILRTSSALWGAHDVELRKTGERFRLAGTQDHHMMEGREIVRSADVSDFNKDPEFAKRLGHVPGQYESLYPPFKYEGYAWGMSIDLNACTGCNACVIACQSENNIPVVGKDQVLNGREMHWIRVDNYFDGSLDNPRIYSQPVTCMHCENAPCEVVCPVAATTHDHEGLNVMTYNRCVGTRYCSNNCPYKVRRFNFLQYADTETESLKLMRNPDVTVRNRGVMEKCTYCVQRISAARIEAKKENRSIRDGEVVTACQSACPTKAIVFGDINDKTSQIAKVKSDPREYSLLAELNTKPRTTYRARLRNPNPELG